MKLSWQQSQNTIFLLWESKRSIGDIIDTLGWSPKATGNVTRVLRTKYALPVGLRGEKLLNLTIDDAGEEYCLETRIYQSEKTQEDPALLKGIMTMQDFPPPEIIELEPFGTLHSYGKPTAKLKILENRKGNTSSRLVIAEGQATPVEKALEAIHYFYERAGYELTNPEE